MLEGDDVWRFRSKCRAEMLVRPDLRIARKIADEGGRAMLIGSSRQNVYPGQEVKGDFSVSRRDHIQHLGTTGSQHRPHVHVALVHSSCPR